MGCARSLQSLNEQRIFLGGMPPRRGRAMCSVELEEIAYSERVVEGEERCFPAWTMRRSAGEERLVRRARRDRRVLIEVLEGIVRGIAMETLVSLWSWPWEWMGSFVSSCHAQFRDSEPRLWRRDSLSLPETVLTKICIVSSDSEVDELMLEMLDVRRMMIGWGESLVLLVERVRFSSAMVRLRAADGGDGWRGVEAGQLSEMGQRWQGWAECGQSMGRRVEE
ncbi:hypothetical protein J1614_001878 [Plenodomus biglobosus]|nr:hypothetical protein J1614_001878 [Plenodomus biglobosus]